ncbi:MAG: hypothetical protein U0W24_20880 [Bacteroidales bacterium]
MKRQFLLLLLVSCVFQTIYPNRNYPDKKVYYWYFIRIGKAVDKETGMGKMYVKRIGSQVESGSYEDFIRSHKSSLKTGKILLGPFPDRQQAEKSIQSYQMASAIPDKAEKMKQKFRSDSIFSFYFVRPVFGKWIKSVKFQRIPSRVATGTQLEFLDMMQEGLLYEKLAIGPFYDFDLAEKSKFIFRKNGELEDAGEKDTMGRKDIEAMSRKWKSVKIEMVKLSNKKKPGQFNYQVKIKFPKKYFASEAFQTISIKALYADTTLVSKTGFTLQGDYAMDNNSVISFEKGGTYTQNSSFINPKQSKLKGFIIESFIFNATQMIEQDKIIISAK